MCGYRVARHVLGRPHGELIRGVDYPIVSANEGRTQDCRLLFLPHDTLMTSKKNQRTSPERKLKSAAVLMGAAIFALVGCAASRPSEQAQPIVQQHAEKGYVIKQPLGMVSINEIWQIGIFAVDITLTMPVGNGNYPLVIYLPGLGESSHAGLLWRRTWAETGYAVLSAQPTAINETLWSSPIALAGEFHKIAKNNFSARSLSERLTALHGVIEEVMRRHGDRGAGPYSHIDISRIAIAGFDIGAQTAMAVAGEKINGIEPPPFSEAVKCIIALSPFAESSGTDIESRFLSIHVPVLSVTSASDTDPYEWVTSATVRQTPYQHMPPGDKYLLLLSSASHSLLAGTEIAPTEQKNADAGSTPRAATEDDDAHKSNQGEGKGRKGRSRTDGGESRRLSLAPRSLTVSEWLEVTDIQQVSTAYLDATMKNDSASRKWLSKEAVHWLVGSATLSSK